MALEVHSNIILLQTALRVIVACPARATYQDLLVGAVITITLLGQIPVVDVGQNETLV